ncbi:MAG: extracellular solute-binding protein [Buchananella hordeovulneris]|nr:extracellular solute-binding protein [Buchananella hordeovulneris]
MRRSIAAIGACVLGLSLAACGSGDAKTGESTAPAETQTSAEGTDGEAAEGVLTIWADDTRFDVVKEVSADFTAKFGVEVKVVQKAEADMNQEFIAQAPTGEGPDLIVLAHDRLGEMVANGVVGTIDITSVKDQFAKAAVDGVTYDGQTYGVPYAIENIAIVRNNKLTQATPATFDEMIEAGKAAGVEYPFVVQQGENSDPYHLYPFQTSFGAPVFKQAADGSYLPELAMGGEAGAKYAEWLAAQGKAGVLNLNISGDIATQAFVDGKAPFILTGPWNLSKFVDAGMDIAVLPVPAAGDQPAQPFVGVQGFFPSAYTKNTLLVNQYMLEFIATKDVQSKLYDLGKRIPAHTEAAAGLTDANLAEFAAAGANGAPMPALPQMSAVWDFWGATEASIIKGEGTPADAWKTMVDNVAEAISK